MEEKVNGFVIKAVDYKDNDKILTIYTLEKGKITANIKGVKKAGAKLKFAAEPFCFSEYVLVKKGNRNTIINASYVDSFYDLRTNLKKYYISSCVAEILDKCVEEDEPSIEIFNIALEAIKNITYTDQEKKALAIFMIKMMKEIGYSIEKPACYKCGQIIKGRVFFHIGISSFSCENCSNSEFREIREETYNTYKNIYFEIGETNEKDEGLDFVLKFLFFYIGLKTEEKLHSCEALLDVLKII